MMVEGVLLLALALGALLISRLQANLGPVKLPWYRDAVLMLMLPWLAAALVYTLPFFVYRENLQMQHVAYIGGCQMLFFLGAMLVRLFSTPGPGLSLEDATRLREESTRVLWVVAIAGLLGQLMALAGGVLTTRATLLEIVTGEVLARMRLRTQWLAQGYGDSPFVRFNFLGAGGFVFLFMYAGGCVARARLTLGARRRLLVIAWAISLMIVFNALFIRGGRMDVILLAIGMLLAALLDTERHVLTRVKAIWSRARVFWTVLVVVAVAGLIGYMATSFTKNRIGTADAYSALERYHRASPTREVELLTGGNESLEFAVLNLSYLPVPLTTFGYYFDQSESMFPGPFWGQYNFTGPVTFVMRRVGLREEQQTMQEIRRDATMDLRMRGYGENVWATVLRDMAFDLGWWGVLPAMLVLGVWTQRLLLVTGRRRGGIAMGLTPLLTLFLLLSSAHSLFVLESFAVAFYFCLLVMGIQAIGIGLTPRRRGAALPVVQPGGTVSLSQAR